MKKNLTLSLIFYFLFLALIVVVKTVDVQPIGPHTSEIGLATLNSKLLNILGQNMMFYKITKYLGLLGLGMVGVYGFVGLIQWIKRKNILKVDKEILVLGGIYLLVLAIYFFFTKVAVNYRPIIMPDETELEPSFPSSHTILACVVMGNSLCTLNKYIKNKALNIFLRILLNILLIASIVLRFLSGVHWFSDILGGVLLSISLIFLYKCLISND